MVFVFENKAIVTCVTPDNSLLLILRSLNVSSVLGDVFIFMCAVLRVKSKRFRGKVNSSVFVDFLS